METPLALPNFIGAGVAKAATTSLHAYAHQHPDIYMSPVKETNYFYLYGEPARFRGPGDRTIINRRSITREEEYLALFSGRSEPVLGEVSPRYMADARVPGRIAADIPEVKLVIGLREPVDRSFAQWTWARMAGRERLPFAEAIELGEKRDSEGWGWGNYLKLSYYADQLERFYDLFDKSKIHIYLFEEFAADPIGEMQRVFAFLGVNPEFVPNVAQRHNRSGVLPSGWKRALWEASAPLRDVIRPAIPSRLRHRAYVSVTRGSRSPELDPETRTELGQLFRDDILRTQHLIGRDLAHWLNGSPDA